MHETTYIRDPETFRQTAEYYKKEDNLNQTDVNERTLNNKNHIKCPFQNPSNTYSCQICSRLRQICPYSTKPRTTVHQPQKVHSFNKSNVTVQPQTYHHVQHLITPPRKVRVIEQIVYYPQVHNILVQQNPQTSGLDNSLNTTSPNYKYRHRSTAANVNDKFSSPIKVSEYKPEVLTPQELKNLTQSMIN